MTIRPGKAFASRTGRLQGNMLRAEMQSVDNTVYISPRDIFMSKIITGNKMSTRNAKVLLNAMVPG